jgi:predicted transcriptional regulator
LNKFREVLALSQVELAKKLHIKQAAVSKRQCCTDRYLSILRSYIEAIGGQLEIVARFPNQALRIRQFEALDTESRPPG